MATNWPSSLPDRFAEHNFSETPPTGVIRSQMDKGAAKTRPRESEPVRQFTGSIETDSAGRQTFDDFFTNDLSHGALPFDWKHPITRNAVTYRFVTSQDEKNIKYTNIGGDNYRITFKLEILP